MGSDMRVWQPLDVVRVRMQSMRTRHLYNSTMHGLTTIWREEGWRALFRGMASPLAGNAPLNAVMFGAYGNGMRSLDSIMGKDPPNQTSHLKVALAGGWGGFLQCFVTTPMELIKCRQQVFQGQSGGMGAMELARVMVREHGFTSGLYRGFWATVLRDVPSFAAYFWAYEKSKDWLMLSFVTKQSAPDAPAGGITARASSSSSSVTKPPNWVLLVSGAIAGVVTWLSMYPIDVIKTAQQTLPLDVPAAEATATAIARRIWAEEGPRGFVRGLAPTIYRAIPCNAVTFLVYEWALEAMGRADR